MKYEFKVAQEIGWAFAVGLVTALFEILVRFNPDAITDWKTWAVASGAALVRAGAAAAMPVVIKHGSAVLRRVSKPPETLQ